MKNFAKNKFSAAQWLYTIKAPKDVQSVTIIGEGEVNPEQVGLSVQEIAKIWDLVERLYKTGVYPALSFCLRKSGKILLNRSIGHSRGNPPVLWCDNNLKQEPAVLMTPNTPVCLFSASKAITAMLIHFLSEKKYLDIMDPISHYLPKFKGSGKRDLTIYHILSHRAGIPSFPSDLPIEFLFDPDMVSNVIAQMTPKWIGGRGLGYHAITGGFVLGEIIELVMQASIKDLLRDVIQKPMNMSFFTFGLEKEHCDHFALNYVSGVKPVFPASHFIKRMLGAPLEDVVRLSNDPRFLKAVIPAGNIFATAEEVSRFFQMLLNEGHYGNKQHFLPTTVRRAIQETGKPEFDRMFLLPMRYSAGFILGANPIGFWGPNSRHAFGHLGFTNNLCWADRERDIACALLTTGNPLFGPHLPALAQLMMQIGRTCKPLIKLS